MKYIPQSIHQKRCGVLHAAGEALLEVGVDRDLDGFARFHWYCDGIPGHDGPHFVWQDKLVCAWEAPPTDTPENLEKELALLKGLTRGASL